VGVAVFHVLFVFFVPDVGDVRVQEEGVSLEFALEEECFFFFEVEGLEFFEAGREVGLFLAFHCSLPDFGLFLEFNFGLHFLLALLFLLESSLHFLLDDSEFLPLLPECLAGDDRRGRVDARFGEAFGGVVLDAYFVGGVGGAREGGFSLHLQLKLSK
jgi:hypothetical protein